MEYSTDGRLRSNQELAGMTVRALWVILIAGLLAALVAAGCPPPVNGPPGEENGPPANGPSNDENGPPVREMPDLVKAGDEFEITVVFFAPRDSFHSIALTQLVPTGWDVSVDLDWTAPRALAAKANEPGTGEYIWDGPEGGYDAGAKFTVVFKVKVPVDAGPGTHIFSGSLRYYIEPHPAPCYEEEVSGDTTVTVSS